MQTSHTSDRLRGQWLDILPDEICERIALHVSRGKQTPSALSLAQTSERQRRAVLSALSHTFLDVSDEHTASWADLFCPRQQASAPPPLTYTAATLVSIAPPDHTSFLTSILNTGILRRLSIPNNPVFLTAVAGAASIAELSISFRYGRELPNKLLFETLASLSLHRLTLICVMQNREHCALGKHAYFFSDAAPTLASVCPKLAALQVQCVCSLVHSDDLQHVWHSAAALPALRELSINRYPPHSVLPTLAKLDKLAIRSEFTLQQLMHPLGNVLTELECLVTLNMNQVAALANFPHLSCLSIQIVAGAERALERTVRSLPLLHRLSVEWPDEDSGRPVGVLFEFAWWHHAKALPGVMLRTVQAARNLVVLRLKRVQIGNEEMDAILECVGTRLEVLEAPVRTLTEAAHVRLEALMHSMAKHNSNLKRFEGLDVLRYATAHPLSHKMGRPRKRLFAALHRLQVRVPCIDTEPFEVAINSLIPEPVFTNVPHMRVPSGGTESL